MKSLLVGLVLFASMTSQANGNQSEKNMWRTMRCVCESPESRAKVNVVGLYTNPVTGELEREIISSVSTGSISIIDICSDLLKLFKSQGVCLGKNQK